MAHRPSASAIARLSGKTRLPSFGLSFLAVLCCLCLAAGTAAGAALPSYKVGDSVCVQWDVDWRWYEAQVTSVAADRVRVHYPDYGSAWDEWVDLDQVNPRYKPAVGAKVWVEWKLAYYQDTTLSLTRENAAAYFDKKGDAARAASEKLAALDGQPSWAHDAWDGYHYAVRKGLSSAATFDSRIPSNYSLLKSNGTQGSGAAKTRVCCSCNGRFYDNVVVCVDECNVGLSCFTSICTPRLQCCGQKTPFSLETGLCYPPTGVQVCIEADSKGNYTLKIGSKLAGVFGTYVGVSTNFKGNYNAAFSFSGSSGAKASITLLTSDPKTRVGAAKLVWNPSGSVAGGVGFGVNLEPSSWPRSPICELNPP